MECTSISQQCWCPPGYQVLTHTRINESTYLNCYLFENDDTRFIFSILLFMMARCIQYINLNDLTYLCWLTTYEGSMLTYAYYVRTKCKAFPTNMSAMFQADPVKIVASFSSPTFCHLPSIDLRTSKNSFFSMR